MRLCDFIKSHQEPIVEEWVHFARTIIPNGEKLDAAALRDHIAGLLEFIARDMETAQSGAQQIEKSKGQGAKAGGMNDSAAETHGALRFEEGFDIIQMASEFRALRASVLKLWGQVEDKPLDTHEEETRFHEAIDQMQMESLVRFNDRLNHSRSLLLGTLIHDMRNPLTAISNAAELLKTSSPGSQQEKLIRLIERNGKTVTTLVSDLIDATRLDLGKGMPIKLSSTNIGEIAQQAAKDAEMAAHTKSVEIRTEGNLEGSWDASRINRAIYNLVGNALQHGAKGAPVEVIAKGEGDHVVLAVRNAGNPIPEEEMPTIFEPLNRGKGERQKSSEATSMGLGLFITKEIITAHGGNIEVTSTEKGTTFTAWLPRGAEPGGVPMR